jgi:hypothetical protein
MTNLLKIPTWADEQYIYAVVETPRGSTCKLDFDPALRLFTLAKPLMAGLAYPYDWGFIPSTKAEDGDPLDVLVVRLRHKKASSGCLGSNSKDHHRKRPFDPRARPHALGRRDGAQGRRAGRPGAERDAARGDNAIPSAEAAVVARAAANLALLRHGLER